MTPPVNDAEPDGINIPSWGIGPLLALGAAVLAAVVAGVSGLVIADGTAKDVDKIVAERVGDKEKAHELSQRVVRIETKIEAVEEKLDDQKAVLEEIRREVKKP